MDEDNPVPVELDLLIEEIQNFIDTVYMEMGQAVIRRNPEEMDDEVTCAFFRTKERIDILTVILQYLLAFVQQLPLGQTAGDLFRQFREMVLAYYRVLLDVDVREAICREYRRFVSLQSQAEVDAEARILRLYEEAAALIATAAEPVLEDYHKLFQALLRFSEFWFEVRGFNFRRIRKSDIYIYKMLEFILQKYPASPPLLDPAVPRS